VPEFAVSKGCELWSVDRIANCIPMGSALDVAALEVNGEWQPAFVNGIPCLPGEPVMLHPKVPDPIPGDAPGTPPLCGSSPSFEVEPVAEYSQVARGDRKSVVDLSAKCVYERRPIRMNQVDLAAGDDRGFVRPGKAA
jgi:hypothetical protein